MHLFYNGSSFRTCYKIATKHAYLIDSDNSMDNTMHRTSAVEYPLKNSRLCTPSDPAMTRFLEFPILSRDALLLRPCYDLLSKTPRITHHAAR